MALKVYNSRSRSIETFEPLVEGHVGIYVCGPTVYSDSHVGHAKSYISFDVLVRYLRYIGFNVLYVQNITDVGHLLDDGEDRMLKQSRIERLHPMQIAESITKSYFDDMDAMGLVRPDISPRATGHIIEQIELVRTLVETGYAYVVNGSVYFDVRSYPEYGALSGRTLDDAVEGTRVDVRSEKRNPQDFALWKNADPEHIMRWPSPWGVGFPGWHVECSAMSMKYLGETFDIHGGGLDNQFPHHECELAQSVSATGKPFARYWMHNNLVTVYGKKMSKSLGNFVTLKNLFAKYDPLVVRLFVLQSHYRSTLDFSEAALDGAQSGYQRMQNTVRNLRTYLAQHEDPGSDPIDVASFEARLRAAMDEDVNAPQAVAVLFDLAKEVNARLAGPTPPHRGSLAEADRVFREFGQGVLGIIPDGAPTDSGASVVPALMDLLIGIRKDARAKKDFALSDRIRDSLGKAGVTLEDRKDGTVWKTS